MTTDPVEAWAALAAGASVVLVATAKNAAGARAGAAGEPGRLAILIGDPDDPADREAAEAMAEEVFGRR